MSDERDYTAFFNVVEQFKRDHPDFVRAQEVYEQCAEMQRVYNAAMNPTREWIDNKTSTKEW